MQLQQRRLLLPAALCRAHAYVSATDASQIQAEVESATRSLALRGKLNISKDPYQPVNVKSHVDANGLTQGNTLHIGQQPHLQCMICQDADRRAATSSLKQSL